MFGLQLWVKQYYSLCLDNRNALPRKYIGRWALHASSSSVPANSFLSTHSSAFSNTASYTSSFSSSHSHTPEYQTNNAASSGISILNSSHPHLMARAKYPAIPNSHLDLFSSPPSRAISGGGARWGRQPTVRAASGSFITGGAREVYQLPTFSPSSPPPRERRLRRRQPSLPRLDA
jgi:hypothetical protein